MAILEIRNLSLIFQPWCGEEGYFEAFGRLQIFPIFYDQEWPLSVLNYWESTLAEKLQIANSEVSKCFRENFAEKFNVFSDLLSASSFTFQTR